MINQEKLKKNMYSSKILEVEFILRKNVSDDYSEFHGQKLQIAGMNCQKIVHSPSCLRFK